MRYYPVQKRKFERNEIIFSEASPGDGMYIIESGRVRVFKTVVSGETQKEIDLCTLGPKAMFGEMSIIDDNPRSATVQAIAPTLCMVITRKIFEEQMQHIPSWMINMIKILVMRLRETNDKLRTIIEQNGPALPVDSGRIITVDEDALTKKDGIPQFTQKAAQPGESEKKKHYKSEDIVKDLYN
jgi:CRP-like cAMP-binding protein